MLARNLFRLGVAAAGLLSAFASSAADAPPVGVYGCYDVRMGFSPVSGNNLVVTPAPFVMFGLIDDATYSDWDGHHGHYTYDPANGILTMTDGSRQGWRYHKAAEWSFRLIDNQTEKEIYTCPLQRGKNPARGPW